MKKIYYIAVLLFAYMGLFAQNIVEYEYWIDDNYANRQPNKNSSQTLQWQATIDCESLTTGLHALHMRFKDSNGLWSSTKTHYFQKLPVASPNEIVYYEYWINDDYDKKHASPVSGKQTFILLDEKAISGLSGTANVIHFRFKDKYGLWSPVASTTFTGTITSIDIPTGKTDFIVTSNPATSATYAHFYLEKDEYVSLHVFDLGGRYIMNAHDGNLPAGKQQIHIDLNNLSKGIYFLRLQRADKSETRKISVH